MHVSSRRSVWLGLALASLASFTFPGVPHPTSQEPRPTRRGEGVRMTSLAVRVAVVDGVATTRLRQVLHNDLARVAEARWILPLPAGAVADDFKMTVGGVEMPSEVLAADDARTIYERIVRSRRDPGLLEFLGRGCLRARVFPIPPRGDVEVDVVFRHVLPRSAGLFHWSFPLHAAGLEGLPPEKVTLDLSVDSTRSIRNVFSPLPQVEAIRAGDRAARASFEGSAAELENGELEVFYGLSEEDVGLDLLSHRRKGDAEGSFLMMISPRSEWAEREIAKKDITFVLDTSGSMRGPKLEQARAAVRQFLQSLRPQDRFNVVPFATEAQPFFPAPVTATPANVTAASSRVDSLVARGGTNIADALARGLTVREENGERVRFVVFLTDGLPTIGTTLPKSILSIAGRKRDGTRIFVFGVGHDVDTHLLDELARQSGGTRAYVREHESIEAKTGELFTKLSHPVLTDLELSVEGATVSRVVPAELPDLFRGGRLLVFGRYDAGNAGSRAIRLAGTVDGERRETVYEGSFASKPVEAHSFVPVLWAERRVGVLLDAIRLNGESRELREEVERLGREYRIVTPYTSHLVLEDGLRGPLTGSDGWFLGSGTRGPRSVGAPSGPGSGGGGTYRGPGSTAPASPGSPGSGAPAGKADLDSIAQRLRIAGVLPRDATEEEAKALALEIAREMRSAADGLRGLGREKSGKRAVDDSTYLADLIAEGTKKLGEDGRGDPGARLLQLFSRRVGDKVFHLRQGVWVDRELDAKRQRGERKIVAAYSKDYFELLRARPELRSYFAFSARLVLVWGETVFEVRPPEGS